MVCATGRGWRDKGAQPATYFLIPYDVRENRIRRDRCAPRTSPRRSPNCGPKRLLVLLGLLHAGGMEVKALAAGGPAAGFAAAIPPGLLMGTLPAGETALSAAEGSKGLEQLAQGTGRAVLSSSQGEQLSYIRRDRMMSIFTYHLIEALTGHARPADWRDGGAGLRCHEPRLASGAGQRPRRGRRRAGAGLPGERQLRRGAAVGRQGVEQRHGRAQSAGDACGADAGSMVAQTMGGSGVQVARDQTVQGDLVIGNKIGRQINTDGGAYIGGNVTTGSRKFVGRDDVTVVGDGNVVGNRGQATVTKQAHQGTTVEAFTRLLAEIRTLLPQAGLDLETAQSVDADVQVIEQQAAKPRTRPSVASKLEEVTKLLTAAGGLAIAGGKLLPLDQKAVEFGGPVVSVADLEHCVGADVAPSAGDFCRCLTERDGCSG